MNGMAMGGVLTDRCRRAKTQASVWALLNVFSEEFDLANEFMCSRVFFCLDDTTCCGFFEFLNPARSLNFGIMDRLPWPGVHKRVMEWI